MTIEEFAKRIEERLLEPYRSTEQVKQYVEGKWYRVEDSYRDAEKKYKDCGKMSSFESEIITVSYAMSLDYRPAC